MTTNPNTAPKATKSEKPPILLADMPAMVKTLLSPIRRLSG